MLWHKSTRPLSQSDLARLRRWLLLLVAVLLWISSGAFSIANGDDGAPADDGPVVERVWSQSYEEHGITITPARSSKVTINGLTYAEVYDSIPYHRSEGLANPSYRHDATMEILFGELRPMTIVRNMPQAVQQPVYPRPYYGITPYRSYFGPYGWGYGTYGLRSYRWSLWDNFLYRHSAFMFGVR